MSFPITIWWGRFEFKNCSLFPLLSLYDDLPTTSFFVFHFLSLTSLLYLSNVISKVYILFPCPFTRLHLYHILTFLPFCTTTQYQDYMLGKDPLLGKSTSGFEGQHLQKAKEEEKDNFHWYLPIILIFILICNNRICNSMVTRPNRIWKWKNIVVDKWQTRVPTQYVNIFPLYEIPKVCWCIALSFRPKYWLLLIAIIPFAFRNHLVLKVICSLKSFPIFLRCVIWGQPFPLH